MVGCLAHGRAPTPRPLANRRQWVLAIPATRAGPNRRPDSRERITGRRTHPAASDSRFVWVLCYTAGLIIWAALLARTGNRHGGRGAEHGSRVASTDGGTSGGRAGDCRCGDRDSQRLVRWVGGALSRKHGPNRPVDGLGRQLCRCRFGPAVRRRELAPERRTAVRRGSPRLFRGRGDGELRRLRHRCSRELADLSHDDHPLLELARTAVPS